MSTKKDLLFAQSDEGQVKAHSNAIVDGMLAPTCPGCKKHFGSSASSGTWGDPDKFKASMRIRLPELVADYLLAEVQSPALRRLIMAQCADRMKEATFFDLARLQQELKERNAV
eukprot:gb/GEZN01019138.1/.p1 GENE.gb/GEZN01019138.1/~~gb/GEZN01019138.1/.p1  ORF type:complete len:114 (+),score=22.40 gb/GEZN01019138.1/:150-491(+)